VSLQTYSLFFFGHTVTSQNCSLDFDEGGAELQATLDHGFYTPTQYLAEVKRVLDAVGAHTYTPSLDRATRKVTVAATGNFTFRVTTGSRVGTSAFPMLGYTSNKTGAASYLADVATGSAYEPQHKLEDYVPPENNLDSVDEKVNESTAGEVEVVKFGNRRFMKCNIVWATDKSPTGNAKIKVQASAIANLRTFMEYLCTKAPVEFMPNIAAPGTFYSLRLESTRYNKAGTGYELKEYLSKKAPGYFETELLTFRVVS
jgi:hypothetical protein